MMKVSEKSLTKSSFEHPIQVRRAMRAIDSLEGVLCRTMLVLILLRIGK